MTIIFPIALLLAVDPVSTKSPLLGPTPSSTLTIPVSAPFEATVSGKASDSTMQAVVRVLCIGRSMGTGFVHQSGHIITAGHVIAGCPPTQVKAIDWRGTVIDITDVNVHPKYDLAILKAARSFAGGLKISAGERPRVGSFVSTWGYPAGYGEYTPLLTAGYVAGYSTDTATGAPRIVVNAAFNSGNSGGPLLLVDDGSVIGVVASKLAPMPEGIQSALTALASANSGMTYTETFPDGTTRQLVEGQVVAAVLEHLRSQTQLVVGYAATRDQLVEFLRAQKIEP